MKASDSKRIANRTLDYMREHVNDCALVYGYCWSALATIAGTPDRPLPCDEIRDAALKAAKREA